MLGHAHELLVHDHLARLRAEADQHRLARTAHDNMGRTGRASRLLPTLRDRIAHDLTLALLPARKGGDRAARPMHSEPCPDGARL
jgi:hypothetical protein